MPERVVEECLENNCQSIAYTYSEPITFYEYTLHSAKIAHERGAKNVLVSAGYINEEPLRNLARYIDAANIDLKSFRESIYLKLNAGKLQPVLNTLKILHEENVWLEITNLVIPNWTDDFDMIREMCDWLYDNGLQHAPLHFSRFHPMYKLTQLPPTPVATLEKAREIALESGIRYVYIGNVPGTKASHTFCPGCNKAILERRGYVITSNQIRKGHCIHCNEPIAGVWN
jgi:pyruvate formate lyase activating enzyme